jgi:hypothetical protein
MPVLSNLEWTIGVKCMQISDEDRCDVNRIKDKIMCVENALPIKTLEC